MSDDNVSFKAHFGTSLKKLSIILFLLVHDYDAANNLLRLRPIDLKYTVQ